MTKFLGMTLVIALVSPTVHAKAVKAAKASKVAASEKYAGSRIEKRMLLQVCEESQSEDLAEVCQKKASELTDEDVALLKSACEAAESSDSSEAAESPASSSSEQVVASKVSINVSSGSGQQQSTSIVQTGAANCVAQATANITKFTASFNQRMNKVFQNKK